MRHTMSKRVIIATMVFITIFSTSSAFAQSPTGLQVMTNVYERPHPQDLQGSLSMTLENSRGDQRVRNVRQYLGRFNDVEKKILFFTAPADVRDTSFMNWSYEDPDRSDDQWIYLPALRRVRRISAEKSNDGFMGSDFSYDDLGERHPARDTHRVVRTETVDGILLHVVESIPADSSSAYGRTMTWVADGIWIGLRKEFYDPSGELLKTLEVHEYSQMDSFWTITRMTMSNDQSGHSTIMELSDLRLNTGISEDDFTERGMTRGIR
jgi:outer membrane lipoprotein-sorting protein